MACYMVCHAMPHMACYAMVWYAMVWFALLCSGSGSGCASGSASGSLVFRSVLVLLLSVFVTLIRKMQHAWLQRRECGEGRGG